MLFNSIIFVLFALIFFGGNHLIRHRNNARLIWLTLASFVFYGWWDWRFLFLICLSGFIDFFGALGMERFPKIKKVFFYASILINLGTLSLFKYSGFIASNIDKLLGLTGGLSLLESIPDFFLITPVGISFYTFQSMSYTFDVYRERMKPTHNILHFFAFLSMFPQLVAGPIVRAYDLLPQLLKPGISTREENWTGLQFLVKGYFKKMVIADNLAPIVVAAFSNPAINPNSGFWWGVLIAFAFQIYCDFSGYSDIARGLARLMGYDFPDNFNHPYTSTSLREFWSRWHITLSTWFRDYVYIALGGNQKGKLRGHINLWATMILSGLWHGAAWTYIIWGAIHAFFLSVERLTRWPELLNKNRITRYLACFLVLLQVLVAFVFFRAESVTQAYDILKVMFSFKGGSTLDWNFDGTVFILAVFMRELFVMTQLSKYFIQKGKSGAIVEMAFYGLLIASILFFRGNGSEFIYFQF